MLRLDWGALFLLLGVIGVFYFTLSLVRGLPNIVLTPIGLRQNSLLNPANGNGRVSENFTLIV